MNVFSNFMRSLAACASASSLSRGIRSILFSTRIFGRFTVASLVRIASASSSIPALASSSTQTRSASCAPLQAVDTMARSSLRLGRKMPGPSSFIFAAAGDAFARNHDGGADLFGVPLVAADAFGRIQSRQIHRDTELRIVMRPGALDLAIDRRRQALALRPFLQHRLGIAQRPPQPAHALRPVAVDGL